MPAATSYRGVMPDEADRPESKTTFGPYPGDALAPPPTPQAPEIPMSESWPWIAGIGLVLRFLIPLLLVIGIVLVIIGLFAHWF